MWGPLQPAAFDRSATPAPLSSLLCSTGFKCFSVFALFGFVPVIKVFKVILLNRHVSVLRVMGDVLWGMVLMCLHVFLESLWSMVLTL